ncbi:DUF2066 domain-containing protein [Dokdonella koreensis]|uniref:DUF2066 domain-containing protein n=1 Tax=Dokdonella koreensis DS-123 TaxID=1300342 RepID=A0A160DVP5_9GAMM|nr:DUF2066 domain-containing protein [Dokdonella koreensis]ANB17873.1 Hypothetical protein I596_1850 [Dokdonella koreensis DS-123]
MLSRCLLFLIVMVSCAAVPAAAGSHTGEAPVASQGEADRGPALAVAMTQVLVRLAGDESLAGRADVARETARAATYMLQYQYRRDVGLDGQPQLVLVAEFDPASVAAVLGRLGVGVAYADRGAPTEARLWIGGIRSAEDFARIMRYLGSLDLVRQSATLEARGDGVLMRVALTVGLPYFLSTVDTSATLTVVNGQPPVEGVDATLILGR